ncbi:MAG: glycosyltransferase family 2 protein [Cyanobacteriota bacterium]|nr:glycosyltransferase family 2 protein [Cyanobacteriota bacterium]
MLTQRTRERETITAMLQPRTNSLVFPPLVIVTVAHHSAAVLPKLAQDLALQQSTVSLWVVVDNSPESSPVDVASLTPTMNGEPAIPLRVLKGQEGDGFGAGCNRALAWLEEQGWQGWVWLLNPDVALPRGEEQRELHQQLVDLPPRSLVGTAVDDGHGGLEASGGWFIRGLRFRSRRLDSHHQGSQTPLPLDWLSGCSLALKPSAHTPPARFDLAFPLYYEDMDLCLRLGRQGAPVLWLPRPRITHRRGAGSASSSPRRWRLSTVSYLRFLWRHCPAWVLWLRTLRLLLVTTVRLPLQPARSRAVLAGVLEAWRQTPAGGVEP